MHEQGPEQIILDPELILPGSAEEERIQGEMEYLQVLQDLHAALNPRCYLEIGVRFGRSLALARGPAIGVDPQPAVKYPLSSTTQIFEQTSDEFFQLTTRESLPAPVDFAFIDGLHLFEAALRDFMNIEKLAAAGAVVAIDDILPNHQIQASRKRRTKVWTGDVWKLLPVLHHYRPDLVLALLDTTPTGCLLVGGLDPTNRILWEAYDTILHEASKWGNPPAEIISRTTTISPISPAYPTFLRALSGTGTEPQARVEALRQLAIHSRSTGEHPSPAVSVIVIGYNMQRELPRTIRSLSPSMQKDIRQHDYEILVVDNGSTPSLTAEEVHSWSPNARLISIDKPTVSPVPAINFALSQAQGELIGVFIDGARMASPRLLASALEAARLHSRPAIGTLSFHLGPDVQMRSVRAGYNQEEEDHLLAASGWEQDSYRLFEISVFAGSSEKGWFHTPAETNSLFLTRSHWQALGGYDPRFISPGGGLANLDIWARLCADPSVQTILLLGEATFHQVHGGIATNSFETPWDSFNAEYQSIHGKSFEAPEVMPLIVGRPHAAIRKSLTTSLEKLSGEVPPLQASRQLHRNGADPRLHPRSVLTRIRKELGRAIVRGNRLFTSKTRIL